MTDNGTNMNFNIGQDDLIASQKNYRIFAAGGPTETVPTRFGTDIYYDPNIQMNYRSGILSVSPMTPAGALAHEFLGRGTQVEQGIPHGAYGSKIRADSNRRAINKANPAFDRLGMDRRVAY